MATKVRVLILGAGPTGLLTAWALKERGISDVCIIEKTGSVGGLAKRRTAAGWHVDFGPHRFQTRDERIRAVIEQMVGAKLREVTNKRVGVWLRGSPVDYPPRLGQVIRALPAKEVLQCGASFIKSRLFGPRSDPAHTYEGWTIARYGNRFYQLTLAHMARKMWAVEPPALSEDLAIERDVLGSARGLMFGPSLSRGYRQYQERFYYPQTYFGELWERAVTQLQQSGIGVILNAVPTSLRIENNRVLTVTVRSNDGEREFNPHYVVSTIPLPYLVSAFGSQLPSEAHVALERILYRALVIVYLIMRKSKLSPFHFIYFPEPEYVFQRLFEQKNFADQPQNSSSTVIGAEISCFEDDSVWRSSDDELRKHVVEGLERAGLATTSDIGDCFTARESHAYPMYTWNYRGALDTLLDELGKLENLILNGRQGLFKFNNIDHCVEMGLAAAHHIATDQPPHNWQAAIRSFKQFKVID